MEDNSAVQIAFCWFQENEWKALKKIDPDSMDHSYDEWLKSANKAIYSLQTQGSVVNKVTIRVGELIAWCDERSLKLDSQSRSQYAVYKLQLRNQQ